jgi:hypothetical protein
MVECALAVSPKIEEHLEIIHDLEFYASDGATLCVLPGPPKPTGAFVYGVSDPLFGCRALLNRRQSAPNDKHAQPADFVDKLHKTRIIDIENHLQ